jgi:hypothetical protein
MAVVLVWFNRRVPLWRLSITHRSGILHWELDVAARLFIDPRNNFERKTF